MAQFDVLRNIGRQKDGDAIIAALDELFTRALGRSAGEGARSAMSRQSYHSLGLPQAGIRA